MNSIVSTPLTFKNGIWYGAKGNYWSNISKTDNKSYMSNLDTLGSFQTMKNFFPKHEDVIFSPKRTAGIATLDISENDTILDAGCMWGALTIPLARTKAKVVGIDQTEESLLFLKKRKEEEGLENLDIICGDLKQIPLNEKSFDKIVLNGVLEWIPQPDSFEVENFIGKKSSLFANILSIFKPNKNVLPSPKEEQLKFLSKIHHALKDDGVLMLAIENRYDIFYFFGLPEPHCGIRFISLFPRKIQTIISKIVKGVDFRNWTYSRKELEELLLSAGFSSVNFHYAFPGYHAPELLLSEDGFNLYNRRCYPWGKTNIFKKILVIVVEYITFKKLKLKFFSSSFILHAFK